RTGSGSSRIRTAGPTRAASDRRRLRHHLGREVAGRDMRIANRRERRLDLAADALHHRAAVLERAADAPLRLAGDVAGEFDAVALLAAPGLGDGIEQDAR